MKTIVPSWLEPHVVGYGILHYSGEEYHYAVASARLAKAFGDNAPEIFTIYTQGILAISETCPEEYRELCLLHELIENPDDASNDEFACYHAVREELQIAQTLLPDIEDYIEFRKKFFDDLVTYYENKKRDAKEEKLLMRLMHSKKYLDRLSA